jgi:transcriptional regulator with XRE-family HTH domain
MTKSATPGAMLKALRLERRLTLIELSARTGLPASTISKVENDKMYLTYDKLQALSTGLGIDTGVLFNNPANQASGTPSGRRSVHKIGEGKQVETHLTSYLYLASELRNKQFIPLITEVRARSLTAFGEMLHHPGEEFTYVLEGSLEFHSQLYTPLLLSAGESIYFDSGMPHAYVAVGEAPCRIMTICSSTEAQLFEAVDRSRPLHPELEALRVQAASSVKKKKDAAKQPIASAARSAASKTGTQPRRGKR